MKQHYHSDKEIWFWYKHIEAQEADEFSVGDYCMLHDLDHKKFVNMRTKIFYKRNKPKEYAQLLPVTLSYMKQDKLLGEFVAQNNITLNRQHIQFMAAHLRWLAIIDKMKKERGDISEMNFIPVRTKEPEPPQIQHQVVAKIEEKIAQPLDSEAKNSLEIGVGNGIKVIIAPEIDSAKIIKIISFLKEL